MVLTWSAFGIFNNLRSQCLNAPDFWPKCIRCAFQCLSYSLLSEDLMLQIILTGIAIAFSGNTIKTTCKALAVQLETPAIPAVAASEAFGWSLQKLVRVLGRDVAYVKICFYLVNFVLTLRLGNELTLVFVFGVHYQGLSRSRRPLLSSLLSGFFYYLSVIVADFEDVGMDT